MKLLWVLIYNFFIYPLFIIMVFIASIFNKKIKEGIKGRFESLKILKEFSKQTDYSKSVYWFHAASFGEYEQARPVISGLKEILPHSLIVVSFFSPSGYNNVKDSNIDCKIYLPFDFIYSARKAIKYIRPKKIIFASYDIWPNLVWVANYRKIHTNIFAASFQPRSRKFYPVIRSFYKTVYMLFSSIYTISENDNDLLKRLISGDKAPVVKVLGNPRYDQVKRKSDKFSTDRSISVLLRKKRIIIGSVWPEDEAAILEPLIKLLQDDESLELVWAPHEPDEKYLSHAVEIFNEHGLKVEIVKRKIHALNGSSRVYVIGVVGVLSRLYWDGQIAYVGGGFSTGVHNVMEPAIARLPVLFGPKHSNSHEAMELIKAGGGFNIKNSDDFYQMAYNLLDDKNLFLRSSLAATNVIHDNLGSSTRVVRGIIRD